MSTARPSAVWKATGYAAVATTLAAVLTRTTFSITTNSAALNGPRDSTQLMMPVAMLNGRVSALGVVDDELVAGLGNIIRVLSQPELEIIDQVAISGQPVDTIVKHLGVTWANASYILYNLRQLQSGGLGARHVAHDVSFRNAAFVGQYALHPSPGWIIVYDLDSPSGPRAVRHYTNLSNPTSIEIVGTSAYVGQGNYRGRLYALDVSDPIQPQQLDVITTTNGSGVAAMVVEGTTVYIYAHEGCDYGTEEFVIVDGSDPRNLRLVASMALSRPQDFTCMGDDPRVVWLAGYVYILSPTFGLAIVDVRQPSAPRLVRAFDGTARGGEVLVVGNRLYLGRTDYDLDVLDISDVEHPELVMRREFPNRGETYRLWPDGGRLYLLGAVARQMVDATKSIGEYDLRVVDVSTPASPKVLGTVALYTGTLEPPIWFDGDGLVVRSKGDRALVLVKNELVSVDVSDPTQPRIMSRTPFPGRPKHFEWMGRYGLIGDGATGRVDVLDLADPDRPVVLKFPLPTSAATMGLVGDLIYTFTKPPRPRDDLDEGPSSTTLRLIRLDAAGKPSTISTLAVPIQYIDYLPFTSAATGHEIYVGNNSYHVIDVSDPKAPRVSVDRSAFFGFFGGGVMAAGDGRVILWSRHNGCSINVYDMRDPVAVRLVGGQNTSTTRCSTDAVAADDYVYVANRYDGLTVNFPLLPGMPSPTPRSDPMDTPTVTPTETVTPTPTDLPTAPPTPSPTAVDPDVARRIYLPQVRVD